MNLVSLPKNKAVLLYLSQCLTANTLSTFEVRLGISKENGPSGQRALLKNPGALVEWAIQNMLSEIIDRFAGIHPVRKTDELSFFPLMQKSCALVDCAASSEDAIR